MMGVRSASTWPLSFPSMGAPLRGESPGLGDELGFVPVDEHTLQSTARTNVFAIGDAAGLPTSKAGSVTHFEGEVLVENVLRFLAGEPLDASFDGHTNCFIETGFGKALLIDFNYDTEPLPGHFPTSVGLPLLKESRLNHLGKLMFQPLYWHSLLPGRDLPGVGTAMPTRGKDFQCPMTARAARQTKGKELTMPTATYAGTTVTVNDEGFFEDPSQWTEAMAPEIATERRHRRTHRAALAGDQVHADRVCREGNRTDRPGPRQDLRHLDQGALPAVPQRPGQDGRQDRRHPQAPRLHLTARPIC